MSTKRPPIPTVASNDKYLRPTALPLGQTAGVDCGRCGLLHAVGPCPARVAFDVDAAEARYQRMVSVPTDAPTMARSIIQAIAEQVAAERPQMLRVDAPWTGDGIAEAKRLLGR